MKQITLQITTRNRLDDLKVSLEKNKVFIDDERVHTIICVDGSEDKTFSFLTENYPRVELIHNRKSEGLITCRNRMMSLTKTPYAVSLDDDAHFLSNESPDKIVSYFENHPECAVIALESIGVKMRCLM